MIYSYFINTQTMERSDSAGPAYRYIGDDPSVIVEGQVAAQEDRLERIIEDDPAYPMWETTAFEAPEEVVTPEGIASDSPSLLQMIEGEIGSLHEGDAIVIESHPDSADEAAGEG